MNQSLLLALCILGSAFSVNVSIAQELTCPPMPDKITQVNHDVRSDITAGVGSLGKLKAGDVGVQTEVIAKNLFEKYPNTDRIFAVQMMAATYCSLINNSKTIKDSEKTRLWKEFYESVFKFENSNYTPTPHSTTKPKVKTAPDQKGSAAPINAPDEKINSVVHNAGTIEGLTVEGGTVNAPAGGTATVLDQTATGQTRNVDIKNPSISPSNESGMPSRNVPMIASSGSFDYNLVTNNVGCGNSTVLDNTGSISGGTVSNNKLGDQATCYWYFFVLTASHHEKDLPEYLNAVRSRAEKGMWSQVTTDQKQEYENEFSDIVNKLREANTNEESFTQEIRALMSTNPPSVASTLTYAVVDPDSPIATGAGNASKPR